MEARIRSALARALGGTGIRGAVALVVGAKGPCASVALGHDVEDRFQLASMTKAIVSVGALMLVDQGILSLDAPLGDLLPALAAPQVIAGIDGKRALLRPATTPITLRHLLTHTSGLGYDFVHEAIGRTRSMPPTPGTMASITMPLLFEPGTDWAYGVSTDWVGLAIAAATNEPLDTWLQRMVLAPLGMMHTSYGIGTVETQIRGADGSLTPFPAFALFDPAHEFIPGGAGLAGTAADYGCFLGMLLSGGEHHLSAASFKDFSTNQIGSLRAGIMGSTQPWLARPFNPMPGQRCGWGLGTLINSAPGPDGRGAGSLGWAGIANTFFWVDRSAGLGAVLLMQHLPFADPAALRVMSAFERAVYNLD